MKAPLLFALFTLMLAANATKVSLSTEAINTAKAIDVGEDGTLVVATSAGDIYQGSGDSWDLLSGKKAIDVAICPNGLVSIISQDSSSGNNQFKIYSWTGAGWDDLGGAAFKIACDGNGQLWVVNGYGGIYRRVNNNWQGRSGKARDIGANGDGSVYVIGTNEVDGGFGIFKFDGANGWTEIGGGALRISVDPTGTPWVVNNVGDIYRRNPSETAWIQVKGGASDIAAGGNNARTLVYATTA